MSQYQSASWLVTYDIADPRRLTRVFKRLKKAGIPIQYSVFSVESNAVAMRMLVAELVKLINVKEDDIRAYRLPDKGWRATLGESILPEGLLWQ